MGEEVDKLLPIANVGRIMKKILPGRAKISKEAKETMQECASEFISFVTGEASERCHKENRKTVNGEDICQALSCLGFDNYSEAMLRFLHRLREDYERERGAKAFDFGILERGGEAAAAGTSSVKGTTTIFFNKKQQDLNSSYSGAAAGN